MTPVDFIGALRAPAIASYAQTSVPASFVVAEGALESGWGASQLLLQAKNIFGVKADMSWHGEILTMNTREFLNGMWIMVPAKWRKYNSWLDCINDHAQFFLTNERYKTCFAGKPSGELFATRVAAAGYATDPSYAEKISEIIRGHSLSALD